MKKTIEIIPLKGVKMDNLDIDLGNDMKSIINILGKPNIQEENQLYYDRYEFRLDFDINKKLEFIELQGPNTKYINPAIYGINPFEIEADELVKLLKEKNGSNIDDTEAQYSYCFSDISVGIWRQNIPEDFSTDHGFECAGGPGSEDATEEEKNIWKTEKNKAKFFWTIGVGNVGYYDI